MKTTWQRLARFQARLKRSGTRAKRIEKLGRELRSLVIVKRECLLCAGMSSSLATWEKTEKLVNSFKAREDSLRKRLKVLREA